MRRRANAVQGPVTDKLTMPQLLSINNYYYKRGGSEAVYFAHNKLFEHAGWEVVPFSMRNSRNEPSAWADHFVADTEGGESPSAASKLGRAFKAIYSLDAARRLRGLLDVTQPDVAHAHNIYHHLSPSVLVELKRRDIPVVLTLHDLKLACPAYKMYTGDRVCEACRGGALRNVVRNRCIKNSAAMSALVWLESTLHQALGLYMNTVTRFVVPSRFFLAKFAEWGIDTGRFVHVPNSVDVDALGAGGDADRAAAGGGAPFVYLGRLVPEKGVPTLIRAAAAARVKLRIVGTGPEEPALRHLAADLGSDVEFTGYLSGVALREAVSGARAVVVPSEWYENAPISVMEASALGRPVIGADIGGIPELIRPGETGLVFTSGSVESLVEALTQVERTPPAALTRMGQAGREWMRSDFSPTRYRDRMMTLYAELGVNAGAVEPLARTALAH
jgi:glycosyltransferase involved in cell wall biosynthesis